MNRSLYTKLVLIILVLIISLMAVVGIFLLRGIRNFFMVGFYDQMQTVFSSPELVSDLRDATDEPDAAIRMANILKAHSGKLGIDSGTRNYYILTGGTGEYIIGSTSPENGDIQVTPNILTAITGKEGYASDSGAGYMDVALPITGESGQTYIIYIIDNESTLTELSSDLFRIILEALAIGLCISVMLSIFLAKTMVTPIQNLTLAAEKVASGEFSSKLQTDASDEIGVLTRTFNNMAGQLESNIDNLHKSEQMRKEFVANVSHELRTPITSIRSYAETMYDDPNLPLQMSHEFLRVIVNESDRMANIVQDLLTLSRFDAGSIEFSFEKFDFGKSVKDVYEAMLLEAQRHHHEFVLEPYEGLPQILGDRARVEQVLINMISNAIKYTHDGGRIRISAGSDGKECWCSVKDNGIGIPKEDVEHVFERFYRVDKARSRESGGTGLGLSIAYEIVERHGGHIDLRSRQGHGTTITVYLPIGGPSNG